MKPIAVEELSNGIESLLKEAQKERVLLTRQGKPCAVLFGLENLDEEDWQLARSADFWQMIQERRKGPLIPLVDVKRRLLGAKKKPKFANRGKRKGNNRR